MRDMVQGRTIRRYKKKLRAWLAVQKKALFPRPVDTRLIQILGGTTLTIGAIRSDNRPLTVTLSRGRLLRSERFRRSVVDNEGILANDVSMAISIMGKEYERDVVTAYETDERLKEQGWIIRYIPEYWLWQHPLRVKQTVQQFIYQ